VGRLVADRLGFTYVDDDIVAWAATKGGISPGEVADEERRKSLVTRLLDVMASSSATELGGFPHRFGDEPSSDEIRALIGEAVEQTAARGNVVIVAHAASHAATPEWEALRVLVTASPDVRAARIGVAEGLDPTEAARAVKEADASRRDYLKRFYGVDEERPTHYDLVVNTDVLSFEQVANLVSHAASTR
jgi:cytidylate kinase